MWCYVVCVLGFRFVLFLCSLRALGCVLFLVLIAVGFGGVGLFGVLLCGLFGLVILGLAFAFVVASIFGGAVYAIVKLLF